MKNEATAKKSTRTKVARKATTAASRKRLAAKPTTVFAGTNFQPHSTLPPDDDDVLRPDLGALAREIVRQFEAQGFVDVGAFAQTDKSATKPRSHGATEEAEATQRADATKPRSHEGIKEELLADGRQAGKEETRRVSKRKAQRDGMVAQAEACGSGKSNWLTIAGAAQNNLKNLDVRIPLSRFVCVTGVSGSGKSSLINEILYPALARQLHDAEKLKPGAHRRILGINHLERVLDIDQTPIGRTPRSNPATYIKVFDQIRDLFAKLPDARVRGYKPGRFSFNVKTGPTGGGRCESCEGNGANKLEMDFLADVWTTCPVCNGKRFSRETLQIHYKGKSIFDVLDMDVDEALKHFANVPKIESMLRTLHNVGLGYMKLGQSSTTLSGGEAQRIKLARELVKTSHRPTLYILDEPTTGLHFHDIKRLLHVLHGFVDQGHSVVVIEHNLDVVKTADWVIDLGPEGGAEGGRLVCEGTPEQVAECAESYTGIALREVLFPSRRLQPARTLEGNVTIEPTTSARRSNGESMTARSEVEDPDSIGDRGSQVAVAPANGSVAPADSRWNGKSNGNGSSPGMIQVIGARENNLRNINVEIPRGKMTICAGPSGSGKTSLALDTIYVEGQRRYVESLSSYARQFLGRMQPPKVDHVYGLAPAIAIEQKTAANSPRSTVGTVTEIQDYLRVLWSRLGQPYCSSCNVPIGTQSSDEIVEKLLALGDGVRAVLLGPVERSGQESYDKLFARLKSNGFARIWVDGEIHDLEQPPAIDAKRDHQVAIVVDRIVIQRKNASRITDSVEQALSVGNGVMFAQVVEEASVAPANSRCEGDGASAQSNSARTEVSGSPKLLRFSQHHACDQCGQSYEELSPHNFSFNSRLGWCPTCEGLGVQLGAGASAVVIFPEKSILDGAIDGWGPVQAGTELHSLLTAVADFIGFDPNRPWNSLLDEHRSQFLHGTGSEWIPVDWASAKAQRGVESEGTPAGQLFPGISSKPGRSRRLKSAAQKENSPAVSRCHTQVPAAQVRVRWRGLLSAINRATQTSWQFRSRLESFVTEVTCETCRGGRLRTDAAAVQLAGRTLTDVCTRPLADALSWFKGLKLDGPRKKLAGELVHEVIARLQFLVDVGLHYLTLNRAANTLSGGESQRIRLAAQLGTGLTGVLYVLDEPTIGLHPRDTHRLVSAMHKLRDLGNTLVVVEHDREVIASADHMLDFGPAAGRFGGEVTADGTVEEVSSRESSLTGAYLRGAKSIEIPAVRRPAGPNWLTVHGAREHNLRNVDVAFPLGAFTCVTGVSGSGKSTLVEDILYNRLASKLHRARLSAGEHDKITGLKLIDKVISVDQSPIGNSPTSVPATYCGAFDHIREVFSRVPLARRRGYRPGRFSFLRPGGRCEACSGMGQRCIEMHFLPDVWVRCEECGGERFDAQTLEVKFRGRNIAEVLRMTVAEALEVFAMVPRIKRILKTLDAVGLGYVQLGQSAPTLSGGEAQRVKLAAELARPSTGKTLYILDEPTTGLHFDDLRKLLDVLHRLVDKGNTVICIEHNLDVIKTADWVIDLGPEAGDAGGDVVAAGAPEDVAACAGSFTGVALMPVIAAGSRSAARSTGSPRRTASGRTAKTKARRDLDRLLEELKSA